MTTMTVTMRASTTAPTTTPTTIGHVFVSFALDDGVVVDDATGLVGQLSVIWKIAMREFFPPADGVI